MKVAIYCRVSTDDKDQNTERQKLKCEQYCELQGHEIIYLIEEYHKGDSSPFERPKFKNIDLKKIDGIIVFTIDRLTRQHPTKVMNLLNYFKSSGVLIVSVTEPIFNMESEFAEPMQYFMSWWNNYFLKKLSNDVKSGLDRARAQGKKLGRPGLSDHEKKFIKEIKRCDPNMSIRSIQKIMLEKFDRKVSIGSVHKTLSEN